MWRCVALCGCLWQYGARVCVCVVAKLDLDLNVNLNLTVNATIETLF